MSSEDYGCPRCSGIAVEVTDTLDEQREFLCAGHEDEQGRVVEGCGNRWSEPFPEIDEQPGEYGWAL